MLWGNRNAAPLLTDTLREAAQRGLHRLVVVTTSAYSSYSSCRQYRENLAAAAAPVREEGLVVQIDKIGPYAGRDAFALPNESLVLDAVAGCADVPDEQLAVLFVTHSIPDSMDETSGPGDGEGRPLHRAAPGARSPDRGAGTAPARSGLRPELVFCSRSGPPTQPWLEPDVNDRLRELAAAGVTTVVAAPIGFVSDHMEVVYDLDTEAAHTAASWG